MQHPAVKIRIFTTDSREYSQKINSEVLLSITAFLLTLITLLFQAGVFLFKTSLRLLAQLVYVLLLASIFILVYAVIMGFYLATGHGINSHIS